jgi:hypothetical protein
MRFADQQVAAMATVLRLTIKLVLLSLIIEFLFLSSRTGERRLFNSNVFSDASVRNVEPAFGLILQVPQD